MAEFSIISDVSNELLKMIKEHVCPDLIQSPEAVALASPTDKKTDFQLGLYLYDIQELREYQNKEMVRLASNKALYPPKPLTLFYVCFLNSRSQMMASSENEQRILGRVMQTLMDNTISGGEIQEESDIALTLLPLTYEEKTKIWSVINEPYQLGIYFSVSPVLLSSKRTRSFQRVVAADFSVEQVKKQ